ncbi:Hypothetical predicted protein [Lecanosticta acicola]|uniref:Steroid 5-alpha reductase C-terminal domain-containing protein n=1 Tax=Lecanosticta acicola TaxID=111012 RepID=A0AAI8YXT8_9PEZI|nr:Hypothetical predicted protein [Lecanosticta acicola]
MSTTQTVTATSVAAEKPLGGKARPDFVPRGNKSSSPLTTTLFLGLRIGDCFLQYGLLALGLADPLIRFLGGNVLQKPLESVHFPLGLTPYRAALLVMVSMAALKHVWFVLCVAQEAWTVTGALAVGFFNVFWFSTNSLFFLTTALSIASNTSGVEDMGLAFWIGSFLYWVGIGAETLAEVQRKQFKDDARNKGKCYMGGLFSICRHINYTGYSLWRAGLGLATGGWILGAVTFAFFIWDFSSRAIPALDAYCTKRYTSQWAEYKRRTPYKILPGIY